MVYNIYGKDNFSWITMNFDKISFCEYAMIHLAIVLQMNTWAVSWFGLLCIQLLWIFLYISFGECLYTFPLVINLGMKFLGHRICTCSLIVDTTTVSQGAFPRRYSQQKCLTGPGSWSLYQHLVFSFFFIFTSFVVVSWYLMLALTAFAWVCFLFYKTLQLAQMAAPF